MKKALVAALAALALPAATLSAQVSFDFPLGVGLRIPSYDRVDGLTIPFGPTVTFGEDRVVIDPVIAYRSHLGKIDGGLNLRAQLAKDSTFGIRVSAERGTFTNERWIRSDLINSVVTLGLGHDARNYYRADRYEGAFTSSPLDGVSLFAGGRNEQAWSTGWRPGELKGPYSFFSRDDEIDGIQRPNPLIDRGRITSGIAGGNINFGGPAGAIVLAALGEVSAHTPEATGSFRQLTIDEQASLNTFRDQKLVVGGHLVTTSSNEATPRQRYAYVGGSGSLATIDLLALGGDQLYFLDLLYVIPVTAIDLPLIGSPYIAPHFATGAASVGGFGVPVQNVGGRVGAGIFAADFLVNPRTHERSYGVGFSFPE